MRLFEPLDAAGPAIDDCAAADLAPDLAVVFFAGRASLPWLKVLKPGFRHCFVLLRTGEYWMFYDPMAHYSFAAAVGARQLRPVLRTYMAAGFRFVLHRPIVPPAGPHRPLPWRPYTCVEAVKRVLALRADWVLTPWQLYAHLRRFRGRPVRAAA